MRSYPRHHQHSISPYPHPTKRRRTAPSPPIPSPNWSDLLTDVLELILKRLSLRDVFSFRAVCSSWRALAKTHVPHPPLLFTFPRTQSHGNASSLYNFAEERLDDKAMDLNLPEESMGVRSCVGSSHGWLILRDPPKPNLFIFNPLLAIVIELPGVGLSVQSITKAILSSNPLSLGDHSYDYGVAAIYGFQLRIAFSRRGDTDWTILEGTHHPYMDVISYRNQIFALSETGSVEVWDLNSSLSSTPVKTLDIEPSFPAEKFEFEQSFGGLFSCKYYLVESMGEFLLAARYIGNFVGEDGTLVWEEDLAGNEDNPEHLVCPYMTMQFHVYALDVGEMKWVKLESLGDRMLFLGGNHSVSLSSTTYTNCKGNSIYFSDDFWDRMDEHDMYGGHDIGKFDMEHSYTRLIGRGGTIDRTEPVPFWVIPNP